MALLDTIISSPLDMWVAWVSLNLVKISFPSPVACPVIEAVLPYFHHKRTTHRCRTAPRIAEKLQTTETWRMEFSLTPWDLDDRLARARTPRMIDSG